MEQNKCGRRAMLTRTALAVMITVPALTACAPLSEDQCRAANWQQIGYQDGVKGRETARYEEERKACADHGIGTDAAGWQIGYAQGLGQYCTASHGYDAGRHGESYGDVCPPQLDAAFRPAYEDGRNIARLVSALDDHGSRMDDITRQLADDDRHAREYVDQVRAGKTPANPPKLMDKRQRRDLENQYNQLRGEYGDLRQNFERGDGELSSRYAVPMMNYDFKN